MSKPIILAVDDEIQVSNAIERDLKNQYGKDYRILKTNSGAEAMDVVHRLKQRNEQVALFVSDQRMPGMEGTELLEQALEIYPEAQKVLLTAYADTGTAIDSINKLALDYYLMKPWDPPEEKLYPVLSDLLNNWQAKTFSLIDGNKSLGDIYKGVKKENPRLKGDVLMGLCERFVKEGVISFVNN